MLIRIIIFFLFLISIFSPFTISALEIDSSLQESDLGKIVESSKRMSQEQINDLFGEDPYLGQTPYLQSPDGFSQRDKTK